MRSGRRPDDVHRAHDEPRDVCQCVLQRRLARLPVSDPTARSSDARRHGAWAGTGEGSQGDTHVSYDCGTLCERAGIPGSREPRCDCRSWLPVRRWEGVCSTTPHCEFRAGSATVCGGRLRSLLAAATGPPASSASATSAASSAAPNRRPLREVPHAAPRRAPRAVSAARLDRAGHATLRLSRRGRTILLRRVTLHAGSNLLQLRLPTSLKRGRCRP